MNPTLTPDTRHTKGSDPSLTEKLQNLEKDDKVEVNCIEETLTVKKENLLDYLLVDENGTRYSLSPDRHHEGRVLIERCSGLSDQQIVRELEVVEQPETFIQDREKTDSRPENGDRYVLTTIYPNGDVEDHAYSNDKKELQKLKEDVVE